MLEFDDFITSQLHNMIGLRDHFRLSIYSRPRRFPFTSKKDNTMMYYCDNNGYWYVSSCSDTDTIATTLAGYFPIWYSD